MTEHDIMYERGRAWVLRDRRNGRYTVFVAGLTHSTSDSAYALDDDGLCLAMLRAEYLAARGAVALHHGKFNDQS